MRRENSRLTGVLLSREPGTAEAGFTLIELMVVLLIIAILLAIAIPTFLGVTNTAGDRAAQSNLTNALTEAKALYEVNQAYTGTNGAYTQAAFQSQAPEFTWTQSTATTGTCGSSNGNCVSFVIFNVAATNDAQGLALATYSSKTNTCWYVWDVEELPSSSIFTGSPTTGTFPSAGTWYGKQSTSSCKALNPTSDPGVKNFVIGGAGQSYSNAATVT
jgi:prepilin-type N-terminal cleavage/methylation domain-containing protein